MVYKSVHRWYMTSVCNYAILWTSCTTGGTWEFCRNYYLSSVL